ncbi:hypothetical protein K488DRAFT_88609 [Vararia minispora EC-137]|uniref:Uncharacterized protein n=1 Tax=Vararia minispora EC-137 TaxID=1314806 RepID=A0ACB8QCZ0_9AGAM|nr:hypothetical protein K488DRAFT_88609 [Vararia minispora EC-137]
MQIPRKLSSRLILLCLSGLPPCTPIQNLSKNLSIPTSWVNTSVSLSVQELQNLAHGAAAVLANATDDQTGVVSGVFYEVSDTYAALALQDYYSGTSTFESTVLSNAALAANNITGTILNSDIIHWALTFYYAYRAYKQDVFLDRATALYNFTAQSFITPAGAASGSGGDRSVPFNHSLNCTNNIAGGVFWVSPNYGPDDLQINAQTVGPFMALSAYLYELTQGGMFKTNAQLSLDFILNNLWNGSIVMDTIFTNDEACASGTNGSVFAFNQAWFIEGLSVWANITGNSTLTAILRPAVPSILTHSDWTAANGTYIIPTDGLSVGDTASRKGERYTIRGLTEVFSRTPGTDIAAYIAAFLNVQFNTIQLLARAPGTNFYSASWVGPPSNAPDPHGNLGVIDILNAAVHVASASSNKATVSGPSIQLTSPSPQPASPSPQSTSPARTNIARPSTGPIVGSIVGSVAGALFLVAIFVMLRRRRKRNLATTSPAQVDPFFDQAQSPAFLDLRESRKGPELPVHSERVANEADSNPSALSASEPVGDSELGSRYASAIRDILGVLQNVLQPHHTERQPPPQYS